MSRPQHETPTRPAFQKEPARTPLLGEIGFAQRLFDPGFQNTPAGYLKFGVVVVANHASPHNTRLLSFTFSASRYRSLPISLNFCDISAMPCSLSFRLAA